MNMRYDMQRNLYDRSNPYCGLFDWAERRTGIPRIYLCIGVSIFIGFYLIVGYGAQLLCNIIGVAYPAYTSIHAIESQTKYDDTKWLIYWVTFAILSVIEYFSGILTRIVPVYWFLKCAFLVWCMSPIENNGSVIIYMRFIRPMFLKHHRAVDQAINRSFSRATNTAHNLLPPRRQ